MKRRRNQHARGTDISQMEQVLRPAHATRGEEQHPVGSPTANRGELFEIRPRPARRVPSHGDEPSRPERGRGGDVRRALEGIAAKIERQDQAIVAVQGLQQP